MNKTSQLDILQTESKSRLLACVSAKLTRMSNLGAYLHWINGFKPLPAKYHNGHNFLF